MSAPQSQLSSATVSVEALSLPPKVHLEPEKTLVDLEASATTKLEAPSISQPPVSSARKQAILYVVSFAQFFDIYNACAAIIALPALGKDLNFEPSSLQWVVSAYTLTFAAFMLISGRLSDIFHPKPVFVLGFLIIGLLSIPIGASVDPIMMIVLRAVQGIGAAMNIPAAVAMIAYAFPEKEERGRAYAIYGAFGAVGNVAGFILGGVLTAKLNWRWVFYLLAILVTPFSIAAWFILPKHENHTIKDAGKRRGIDWPGVFSLTVGLVLFVFAISSGSGSKWGTAQVIAPLVLSIAVFAAFLFIERIVEDPALPPRTWSNKNFTPMFFYGWSIYWWVFGIQVQLVEIFTNLWGYSYLSAALHCLPIGIAGGTSAYLTGVFAPKIPRRILLISGQLFMGTGAILLALADEKSKYWSHVVPAMIVGMIGVAIAYVGSTIAVMEGARAGEEGVVGAMMYTSYQVGATIGLAIVTSISLALNESASPSNHFVGYAASFWSLLGLNGLMCIVAILFVRN